MPPDPHLPGLAVMFVVFIIGVFGSVLAVGLSGVDLETVPGTIVTFLGLWGGFAVVPLVVILRGGRERLVREIGLRVHPSDITYLPIGIVTQFAVAVPYFAWDRVTGSDTRARVGDAAEDLIDRAGGIGAGFWILALCVVIGAPLVEEAVFRCGFQTAVRRALSGRSSVAVSTVVSIVVSAAVFAAFHAQGLQFAALALVGTVLAIVHHRTRRLGPPFFVHMGFNLVATIQLGLQLRG
jgi:uncharacterized protein